MKTTPYELVFGQPPRQNVFPGAKGNSVMEEDVEDLFEDDPDSPVIPSQSCHSNCDEELCTASQPLNEPFNSSTTQTVPPLNVSESSCLGNSTKHLKLREEADANYRKNAELMQLKYTKGKRKKVLTFNVGDFVSIRIPRIDRASTDSHRLLCVVVERLGSNFYLYRLR